MIRHRIRRTRCEENSVAFAAIATTASASRVSKTVMTGSRRAVGGVEDGGAGVADGFLAPGPAPAGGLHQRRVVGLPALPRLDRVTDLIGEAGDHGVPVDRRPGGRTGRRYVRAAGTGLYGRQRGGLQDEAAQAGGGFGRGEGEPQRVQGQQAGSRAAAAAARPGAAHAEGSSSARTWRRITATTRSTTTARVSGARM